MEAGVGWSSKDTAELCRAADTLGIDSRVHIIRAAADRIVALERALVRAEATINNSASRAQHEAELLRDAGLEANRVSDPRSVAEGGG